MSKFETFPPLTRFSKDWIITEKIDGANAQLYICNDQNLDQSIIDAGFCLGTSGNLHIFAGSRNRFVKIGDDLQGFSVWVKDNAEQLIEILGEGRHFGEWCGKGIQRGYGMGIRKFALFNAQRWGPILKNKADASLLETLTTVPLLFEGRVEQSITFDVIMAILKDVGSVFAPGFNDPEGIVMYHKPSGTGFKKTFEYDEKGKTRGE